MRPLTCAPGQARASTQGRFRTAGFRSRRLQVPEGLMIARLSTPRPLPGGRRGRRAGPGAASPGPGAVWGVICPSSSGAHKAQAQRVGWQQHPVAAVLAAASCNRCRQVGASGEAGEGVCLHLALLSYLCQGLEAGGSGRRSRDKTGPSRPGVPALATQQVGEGQRHLIAGKLPLGIEYTWIPIQVPSHTWTSQCIYRSVYISAN